MTGAVTAKTLHPYPTTPVHGHARGRKGQAGGAPAPRVDLTPAQGRQL